MSILTFYLFLYLLALSYRVLNLPIDQQRFLGKVVGSKGVTYKRRLNPFGIILCDGICRYKNNGSFYGAID